MAGQHLHLYDYAGTNFKELVIAFKHIRGISVDKETGEGNAECYPRVQPVRSRIAHQNSCLWRDRGV